MRQITKILVLVTTTVTMFWGSVFASENAFFQPAARAPSPRIEADPV